MADQSSRPTDDPENGFLLRCPVDGKTMTKVQVGTFAVDRCDDCGGMWLDLNEIHRVLAIKGESKRIELTEPSKARPGSGRQARLCPRDGGHMITLSNLPQVHVEYEQCPICGGIYLDRGELNDLNSYTVLERMRNLFLPKKKSD